MNEIVKKISKVKSFNKRLEITENNVESIKNDKDVAKEISDLIFASAKVEIEYLEASCMVIRIGSPNAQELLNIAASNITSFIRYKIPLCVLHVLNGDTNSAIKLFDRIIDEYSGKDVRMRLVLAQYSKMVPELREKSNKLFDSFLAECDDPDIKLEYIKEYSSFGVDECIKPLFGLPLGVSPSNYALQIKKICGED